MKLHHRRPGRRGGFTLIELMVVITIIAVLVSLLSSAVFMALNKVDEVKTRNEISALGNGLVQFQADFNVQKNPPPSRIWLRQNVSSYTGSQIDTDSLAYLRKAWPRIYSAGNINWGPNNTGGDFLLEGQQCLVFFLGGQQIQGANGQWTCTGFATDATNPMNTVGARKGPYIQFDSARLKPGTGLCNFLEYYDPYGFRYAYFSSGKTQNGYNAYASTLGFDCPSLLSAGNPIQPYFQPPPNANAARQYHNPDTFQIISAGKNGLYGPGGQWASTYGSSMGQAGLDDLSNFYNAKLGVTP